MPAKLRVASDRADGAEPTSDGRSDPGSLCRGQRWCPSDPASEEAPKDWALEPFCPGWRLFFGIAQGGKKQVAIGSSGGFHHRRPSLCEVVSIVKSTLGPRGMDKLIEEGNGTTITNDGATVMKKLNIAPWPRTSPRCGRPSSNGGTSGLRSNWRWTPVMWTPVIRDTGLIQRDSVSVLLSGAFATALEVDPSDLWPPKGARSEGGNHPVQGDMRPEEFL